MPEATGSSHEQIIIISTPVELEVGQYVESLSSIPHLTLFPWITIRKDQWAMFDERMKQSLNFTQARNMRAGERANFGTEENPHYVRKLKGLDVDLRVDIANTAIELGGKYDARYAEWDTEAHVSDTDDYSMQEGEVFQIKSMLAVARDFEERRKLVRAIYKWGRASRWYLNETAA